MGITSRFHVFDSVTVICPYSEKGTGIIVDVQEAADLIVDHKLMVKDFPLWNVFHPGWIFGLVYTVEFPVPLAMMNEEACKLADVDYYELPVYKQLILPESVLELCHEY